MALTPVPTIDPALPVPPNPADEEAVFDAKAYAWSEALPGFGSDVKAIGDATYANAQWAETKALEAAEQVPLAAAQVALAAAQVSIAAGHASDAADSATAASASATEAAELVEKYQGALSADPVLDKNGGPLSNGDWYVSTVTGFIRAYTVAGGWVSGLSAVAGVTSVNGNSGAVTGVITETGAQSLTEKTLVNPLLFLGGSNGSAGQVPISQGAGLPVIWGSGSEIIRVTRTSNTAISSTNKGNLIDITSGTFTQTFNSAASLSNGWFCYVRNSGTGDITLDPNSSELIDGLTSYVMYPGEVRLVQCDGVALRTILVAGDQIFVARDEAASGTSPANGTYPVWVTRALNTVQKNTISGASLSSNQITLPAGTYQISARAPSTQQLHKARLYNVTGAAPLIVGSSAANATNSTSTDSLVCGVFSLSATSAVRLEHWNNGIGALGMATSASVVEVYAEITLRRLA